METLNYLLIRLRIFFMFSWWNYFIQKVWFPIMIGFGVYHRLPMSYYVLLVLGSMVTVIGGCLSYMKTGRWLTVHGPTIHFICLIGGLAAVTTICRRFGFLWGIGSFVLFYPVMYLVGYRLVVRLGIAERLY